jgi:hypothetical protein
MFVLFRQFSWERERNRTGEHHGTVELSRAGEVKGKVIPKQAYGGP